MIKKHYSSRPRGHKLTASHKKSISDGLQDYWSSAAAKARRAKTAVVHALPNGVRGAIGGVQLLGKSVNAQQRGHTGTAKKMRSKAWHWMTGGFPKSTDPKGNFSGMHSSRKAPTAKPLKGYAEIDADFMQHLKCPPAQPKPTVKTGMKRSGGKSVHHANSNRKKP